MLSAICTACKRTIADGETAWAEDFRVIDAAGTTLQFKNETRYTCEDCEAKR